jgi:hypothetical protein
MKKLYIIIIILAVFITGFLFYIQSKYYIYNEINRANYCEVKEDCVNAGGKCPFGCRILVNKNEANYIKKIVSSYKEKCIYDCMPPGEIKCENNKCLEIYS